MQKRFNTDRPVWGRLYEGMLLASGSTVDAAFGARPLFEADRLVRVGALAAEGLSLKPGEVISLGSFSPLLPPKPGLKVTASYEGLPGAAPVEVSFR